MHGTLNATQGKAIPVTHISTAVQLNTAPEASRIVLHECSEVDCTPHDHTAASAYGQQLKRQHKIGQKE
jgi:hypothetical protein